MNDTDIVEETPVQIILNRQAGFRTEIEDILEKRSMEIYRAVKDLTREICSLKEQRNELRDVLEELSLYLSVGMGDETTTAKQYKERILEGIKMLTDPLMSRIKEAEEDMIEGTIGGGCSDENYLMIQVPIHPTGYKVGQKVKVILPEPKLYNNESRTN